MANGFPFQSRRCMNRCRPPMICDSNEKRHICEDNVLHNETPTASRSMNLEGDNILLLILLLLLLRENVDKKLLIALGYILM